MSNTIYNMKLHETIQLDLGEDNTLADFGVTGRLTVNVTRVPSGWIYVGFGDSNTPVFVPATNSE